jgi:hypothetical protein
MVLPVVPQCGVPDVSASGYHQHQARQREGTGHLQPGRRVDDIALLVHIKAIFNEVRGVYGWPRVWRELHQRGIRPGKERARKSDNSARPLRTWQGHFKTGEVGLGQQVVSIPQAPGPPIGTRALLDRHPHPGIKLSNTNIKSANVTVRASSFDLCKPLER